MLHPQLSQSTPQMSQEESLHFLLSGRASLAAVVPSASFALHARESKLNLTAVPHPLAWSAASASSATLATHAHYSASEVMMSHASHAHLTGGLHGEEWRPAAKRGIVPKFSQTPRIMSADTTRDAALRLRLFGIRVA